MIRPLAICAVVAAGQVAADPLPVFDGDAFFTIVAPHGPDGVIVETGAGYFVCFLEEQQGAGDVAPHFLLTICDPVVTPAMVDAARNSGQNLVQLLESVPDSGIEQAGFAAVIAMGCLLDFSREAETVRRLIDETALALGVTGPLDAAAREVLDARLQGIFDRNVDRFMLDEAAGTATLIDGC